MRDSRFVIRVAGLGVAVGIALQFTHAGDRKPAAARHAGAGVHKVAFVAPARSAGENFAAGGSLKGQGRRELSFSAVGPMRAEVGSQKLEVGGQRSEVRTAKPGPTTAPSERKTLKFFRLDPRLGDVSVQPVIGGVNGAQLSVGF